MRSDPEGLNEDLRYRPAYPWLRRFYAEDVSDGGGIVDHNHGFDPMALLDILPKEYERDVPFHGGAAAVILSEAPMIRSEDENGAVVKP